MCGVVVTGQHADSCVCDEFQVRATSKNKPHTATNHRHRRRIEVPLVITQRLPQIQSLWRVAVGGYWRWGRASICLSNCWGVNWCKTVIFIHSLQPPKLEACCWLLSQEYSSSASCVIFFPGCGCLSPEIVYVECVAEKLSVDDSRRPSSCLIWVAENKSDICPCCCEHMYSI